MNDTHGEQLMAFIRENRGNEGNFDRLCARLDEELEHNNASESYVRRLQEIKEKAAEGYKKAKEPTGTAWPEFEKFASQFEKAILEET